MRYINPKRDNTRIYPDSVYVGEAIFCQHQTSE